MTAQRREEGKDSTGKEKRIGLRRALTEKNQNRSMAEGWDRVNHAWEGKAEEHVPLVGRVSLVHLFQHQQIALKPTDKACVCVWHNTHMYTNMDTEREILSDIQGNGQTVVEVVL